MEEFHDWASSNLNHLQAVLKINFPPIFPFNNEDAWELGVIST